MSEWIKLPGPLHIWHAYVDYCIIENIENIYYKYKAHDIY